MPHRVAAVALAVLAGAAVAQAQQPMPLTGPLSGPVAPAQPPATIVPLPAPAPPGALPGALPGAPAEPAGRVFCGQNVGFRLADPATVPPDYRSFLGIWSDADWTPQLCAALIVESVQGDGTAALVYAYGPLETGRGTAGGVLHGTGVVRDGVLLFQNDDGSQFAFKPFYADLQGQLTTPQGQTYQAVFKKTY